MPAGPHRLLYQAFRPSKIVAIFSKKGRRYKNVGDEEAAADDGDGGEVCSSVTWGAA